MSISRSGRNGFGEVEIVDPLGSSSSSLNSVTVTDIVNDEDDDEDDLELEELTGSDDLTAVTFLEVKINAEDFTIRDLGTRLPNLLELKLNNSNIPSIRDLGTSFVRLTVMWLSRCNLHELDGIASMPCLKELYLAFNDVKELSAIVACECLEVLDLEGNSVQDIAEVHFMASCRTITSLTLEGNPLQATPGYRKKVLEAMPCLQTLDDIDRDAVVDDEYEYGGGDAFATNVSVDIDAADNSVLAVSEESSLALVSPAKPSTKQESELMIVHQGIKHARTGIDDVEFMSNSEYEALMNRRLQRPVSGRVGTRPMSASFRPRDRPVSPESVSSDDSGRQVYRPGSAGSGGRARPGSSCGSLLRPSSALAYSRPGSSMGMSSSMRPGTASSSRPSSARISGQSAAWAARRSARQSDTGTDDVASDLTFGTEEIFCGNLTRGLRKRNVAKAVADFDKQDVSNSSIEMTQDDIMEELRRWKIETANLALTPDEDLTDLPPLKVGHIIGAGGGDRLNLDDSDASEDSESESSDSEMPRMQGDDSNSTSDTESQAPTARAATDAHVSNVRAVSVVAQSGGVDSVSGGGRGTSALYKKPSTQARGAASSPTSAVRASTLVSSSSTLGGPSSPAGASSRLLVGGLGNGVAVSSSPVPPPARTSGGPAPRRGSFRASLQVSDAT